MEKFLAGLVIALGAVATIFFFSLFGGTLVWLIWPVAIPKVFPGLVSDGVIAGELGWWVSVCFTWLAGILIKSTNTNNCKD